MNQFGALSSDEKKLRTQVFSLIVHRRLALEPPEVAFGDVCAGEWHKSRRGCVTSPNEVLTKVSYGLSERFLRRLCLS
jgi:hypothetical protein